MNDIEGIAPQEPIVIFIDYDPSSDVVPPQGAYVNKISQSE